MKSKRRFDLLIVISCLLCMMVLTKPAKAAAEVGADATGQVVFVTIADDKGKLALTQYQVVLRDADKDGKLTVNDALYYAHEDKYQGGAAAGYASSESAYGLSLEKLWGIANGGSYGYYVNNVSAMSLAQEIKNGDYINAYAYSDLSTWSDMYVYFDRETLTTEKKSEVTLTLSGAGFDENWNPVVLPVENAVITIDGEKTEYRTDKDGKVTFTVDGAKTAIISAVSDTAVLVPPVCMVHMENTGISPVVWVLIALVIIGAAATVLYFVRKKKGAQDSTNQ